MLVLTRKLQQQILIGNDITITVLRVQGNKVRIGIDAPEAVRVVRGELPRRDAVNASEESEVRGEASSPARAPAENTGSRAAVPDRPKHDQGLRPVVARVSQRCFTVDSSGSDAGLVSAALTK